MYFNNTNCDLYIGTGAGKKLLEEIARAESSVKIVSPYVSAELIDHLIGLYKAGVSVELITCQNDLYSDILRKLVHQLVHIHPKAARLRQRLKVAVWLLYIALAIFAFSTFQFLVGGEWIAFYGGSAVFLSAGILLFAIHWWKSKIKVKSYTYKALFPVRILSTRNEFGRRTTYLHSKIYIIDDKIAYLGSLNFTRGGTESNHETRIRIMDSATIAKINEEFEYLWGDSAFTELDIAEWGRHNFMEKYQ